MAHLGLTIAYTELNAAGRGPRSARSRDGAGARQRPTTTGAHRGARAADGGGGGRRGSHQAAAYRAAVDEALAAYPQDEELWLLRGLAESPDPADRGQGSPGDRGSYFEARSRLRRATSPRIII